MKKLSLFLAAVLALTLGLSACAPAGDDVVVVPSISPAGEAPSSPSDVTTNTDIPATQAPEQTGDPQVEANLAAMMPILDSIVRTMGIGSETVYNPKDPEFFWSVLYLMGVNWGGAHPLVENDVQNQNVIVPRKVMQEFASAAFLDYSDLLDMPESYAQSVTYDEGLDAYALSLSDMGDSYTKLDDYTVNPDGSIAAQVGLYVGDGEYYGQITFTLTANPYADGIADPVYLYTVTAAEDTTPKA